MAIQLIVASADPRFHDFVREQLSLDLNAEIVGEHEDLGPNLAVRILQGLNANPQAAVLLDIASDPEQGLHTLEQMTQAAAGVSSPQLGVDDAPYPVCRDLGRHP